MSTILTAPLSIAISHALSKICQEKLSQTPPILIEEPKVEAHGDFSSNIAMVVSSKLNLKPQEVAQKLAKILEESSLPWLQKIEIKGPGFLNFFVDFSKLGHQVLSEILSQKKQYGASKIPKNKTVLVEYVSVNPTGPLHVGHGRGAAYGDSLVRVLRLVGYKTHAEYYVNDAGRQIKTLATSIFLRILEQSGATFFFPKRAYQGSYLLPTAKRLKEQLQKGVIEKALSSLHDSLIHGVESHEDEPHETQVSELNVWVGSLVGEDYQAFCDLAYQDILKGIKEELQGFSVDMDTYFSEKELQKSPLFEESLKKLETQGDLYEKDGALWFSSQKYGDDRDRVVKKNDGEWTYFATDIAYHYQKSMRFDWMIDVWGADHHGYIARMQGAIEALGVNAKERFRVLLVQLASIYKDGKELRMSTRQDRFVNLSELISHVGKDSARFYYLMHKSDHAMRFDVDKAISRSMDNPVYYVQYAHARICSIEQQIKSRFPKDYEEHLQKAEAYAYQSALERKIIRQLDSFGTLLEDCARTLEVHHLTTYAKELALSFHSFYHQNRVLDEKTEVSFGRLKLCLGVKQVIANTLNCIGVKPLEKM